MRVRVELLAASARAQYNPISTYSWIRGIMVSTVLCDNTVCGIVATDNDEFDVVPLHLLEVIYDTL